jgi:hypothetical protein
MIFSAGELLQKKITKLLVKRWRHLLPTSVKNPEAAANNSIGRNMTDFFVD